MDIADFIKLYQNDPIVESISLALKEKESALAIKGLHGSQDAVIAAAAYKKRAQNNLYILNDREEAAYFHSDLQSLLPEKEILFFPTSYKKPYQYEEVENANVLQRAEVLNRLNQKDRKGDLIVTYPEALYEKVINKKSLVKNTFGVRIGDKLDTEFVTEILIDYGFEKTDFVFEAGQFAIRGGIIDVFSFANELPYRIELFGDEVDGLRTFDPESQLSIEEKKAISIIPDVQTKLLEETRQSIFEYINENFILWFKDFELTEEVIEKNYEQATSTFDEISVKTGDSNILVKPDALFESAESFKKDILPFRKIEFGTRFQLETTSTFDFNCRPQPSFNKNFDLLKESLEEYQSKGYVCLLASDSANQLDRLQAILNEIDPNLEFRGFHVGLRKGFIDHDTRILCYTDHQIFERYFKYKAKDKYSKTRSLTLRELKNLQPGDYVTHIDYGIGRFAGMEKVEVTGKTQETIRLVYKDADLLYVSVHSLHKIAKYGSKDGKVPSMSKLGSPEWKNKKSKVKKKVKEIAFNLIKLYAKRKAGQGFQFNKDTYLQAELESSFLYEDTPDQATATQDVKVDMEKPHPMDRLVCGDVGFGKTEVAIRAAFKAVADSKQVAVMVPTTILALQHYKTFKKRLRGLPCRVDYVNRFRTAKELKEIKEDLKEGKIDILIGTHKLVSKTIVFKDLGLLIIDEEQKFGVGVKEKLKDLAHNIDVLTLTATPIPRTLQFSLMGARDLSVISTPPTNRQPVTTELQVFSEPVIRDAIRYELKRGGQVFFVHNRVNDIEEVANIILKLVPDAKVGVAHGQMDGSRLEKVMMRFIEHDYDILVSTNIIESGLDIPNANTIIINHAHMYGLSDLHQMRGRVGRSNKKAFCYLLTPSLTGLTQDARKRLRTLEEFTELGDGFKIAMRDLDIRGAGDLLGGEQSGFINDLGMETYHKILDETIQELKETEFKELFSSSLDLSVLKTDCNIETDLEILIPEEYVSNISERLRLYNDLDNTKNEEELKKFKRSITDRFGPIPDEVESLIKSVELRWLAENLGFERLALKNEVMKAYVKIENNDKYFQSPVFGKILEFVQQNPKSCKLKEVKGKMILTFSRVDNIETAISKLDKINALVEA